MSEFAAEITEAYRFDGPALQLGALVLDGTAHPDAGVRIPLAMLNRHGLVAGATGTGKTKTLQLIAEQLSDAGVPVFLADIKGDVSGMAAPGQPGDRITSRAKDVAMDWSPKGFPVEFLSIGGMGSGTAVRASISSFGPQLLAKVLDLGLLLRCDAPKEIGDILPLDLLAPEALEHLVDGLHECLILLGDPQKE